MFTIGQKVTFHTPFADEVGCTYIFREDKGDRCLIQLDTIEGVEQTGFMRGTKTVMTNTLVAI